MKSNIFIPKKIKIGFNERNDTYTGLLGYVIYHDGKTWRKENSWESWRFGYISEEEYEIKKKENYVSRVEQSKKSHQWYIERSLTEKNKDDYYKRYVDMTEEDFVKQQVGDYSTFSPNIGKISKNKGVIPVEYTNEPLDGFVLNKKVGGYKSDWNFRQAYCRVYDPRGFEFEITIPNLLYILENANSIKGKGLEGKFIYGWDGKDLVLLPEEAPEYKEMVEFTENLSLKVSRKDLKVGGIYLTSSGEKVTFLAESPTYNDDNVKIGGNSLWFHNEGYYPFQTHSISTIKKYIGDNPDIANLLDQLEKIEGYKPKNTCIYTYVPYTLKQLSSIKDNYYRNTVWIPSKTKGKYKQVTLYTVRDNYYLQNGHGGLRLTESYKSIKELLENNIIYKQIKTPNEKER